MLTAQRYQWLLLRYFLTFCSSFEFIFLHLQTERIFLLIAVVDKETRTSKALEKLFSLEETLLRALKCISICYLENSSLAQSFSVFVVSPYAGDSNSFIISNFSAVKSKLFQFFVCSCVFFLYRIKRLCIKFILLFGWKWFHCAQRFVEGRKLTSSAKFKLISIFFPCVGRASLPQFDCGGISITHTSTFSCSCCRRPIHHSSLQTLVGARINACSLRNVYAALGMLSRSVGSNEAGKAKGSVMTWNLTRNDIFLAGLDARKSGAQTTQSK